MKNFEQTFFDMKGVEVKSGDSVLFSDACSNNLYIGEYSHFTGCNYVFKYIYYGPSGHSCKCTRLISLKMIDKQTLKQDK